MGSFAVDSSVVYARKCLGGTARWVPHEKNLVGCVTKLKGNAAMMLELLRKARYRLTAEADEMVKRKEYRELTGKRNPRQNCVTDEPAEKRRGQNDTSLISFMYTAEPDDYLETTCSSYSSS